MKHILQQYGELLATVDGWFSRSVAVAGEEIACKEGCSGCCRGLFDITLLDACLLKSGFDLLAETLKKDVLRKASERLAGIKAIWPEFAPPYILNHRDDREWEQVMPEDDETPCVLLGADGRCLVYAHRPMTCRLHGVPLVDVTGEVMDDACCSLNFAGSVRAIHELPLQRHEFIRLFEAELSLFKLFTARLLKEEFNELDTLIPAALLMDFTRFGWEGWVRGV
jgi:Fe-S-cluster containining protein